MITFIHAADLHLDTPFSGLERTSKELASKLREAPFESLANIVDKAIAEGVDFVLLAGDLYNTEHINIKAQSLFVEQLERLNQAEIPVFLTRGNHDYLTEDTKTLSLPLPNNVFTYTAEVTTHQITTKNNQRVAVTGFSYDSKWIFERKIEEYPTRQSNVDLQIGILHGSLDRLETTEATYAPFTINELQSKQYDYWALGHIHKRQQISDNPLAIYPGNIQGLHKNETGPKGAMLVKWSPREITTEFFKTAPVVWQNIKVDISGIERLSELLKTVQGEIKANEQSEDVLIHLKLEATEDIDEGLVSTIQGLDFPDQLTRQLGLKNHWFVQVELRLIETSERVALGKMHPEIWQEVLQKTQKKSVFDEKTANVFQQIPARYLIKEDDESYREEMIQRAIEKIQMK